ncbi:hypothetical protein NSA56_16345 [Oceanobacillus caeni]|uniref:Uncharacterized protein n=1 Tax=Oceanobacillus caeni TaxID=405946 RepID=A0ABR5MFB1_9BACI|nr:MULTISPECIES: hypothetical protein [Bacillaceae]KKE77659.1 hypothetical protein WH51_16820 [Bacilli bacterium VT-13-104]PZD81392.1 hypothetical protein DEJ64_17480 [Bacilli bacterium]KPH69620.1 hypothetical protein AFL42_17000 [Oceanobacillus caeni]MBU8790463.1 hypothetical protein [Oceanobacillus caeni]MCR1835912.1 hypothetical protein [Oceanobacillus caeni]
MDTHQNGSMDPLNEEKSEELIREDMQKYDSDPLLDEQSIRQDSRDLAQFQTVLDNSLFTS